MDGGVLKDELFQDQEQDWQQTEEKGEELDISQGIEMDTLKMALATSPLPELLEQVDVTLAVSLEGITHGLVSNIEGNADSLLSVLKVAASLHDVLMGDVESSGSISLLEATLEKSKVVVLPLDQSCDLVHKF